MVPPSSRAVLAGSDVRCRARRKSLARHHDDGDAKVVQVGMVGKHALAAVLNRLSCESFELGVVGLDGVA